MSIEELKSRCGLDDSRKDPRFRKETPRFPARERIFGMRLNKLIIRACLGMAIALLFGLAMDGAPEQKIPVPVSATPEGSASWHRALYRSPE